MREMFRWTRPVRYLCLILCALSALLLGGCQPMADEEKPLEEGEYLVYYLDSSTTRLAPQPYRPQAKDADGIIAELMEQFQEVPADVDSQPALSDKVVFQKFTRKDQVLYLYFDANYNSMKPEREILCRVSILVRAARHRISRSGFMLL